MQPFFSVEVFIQPDILRSFVGKPTEKLPTALQHLLRPSDQQSYSRSGNTTPFMQSVLQQILRCPYQGVTKRVYLESKALELLALLLDQEVEIQTDNRPASILKPGTLERIHYAREVLLQQLNYYGAPGGARIIRGFSAEGNFRNGFPQGATFNVLEPLGTIEQVEVLKGPASVLFGALEPGGIINTVTKQPLSEPYYKLEFEAGNYGLYQPLIDFSGSLTADKTVLYRLIASYQSSDYFQEFVNTELTTIAPSITLNLGDQTSLNLYYEYSSFFADPPRSFAAVLSDGNLTPRSLYTGYPDLYLLDLTTQKIGYTLKHK